MFKKIKYPKLKNKIKWKLFVSNDIPKEAIGSGGTHMELFGNKEIIVDGCKCVLEYGEEYVKLKLRKGAVIICGSNFDIINFEDKNITVRGIINNIEFCV